MLKRLTILGSVALLLATWGGISILFPYTATNTRVQNFTLISVHVHFKTGDVGHKGPTAGDLLVFNADVMNAD